MAFEKEKTWEKYTGRNPNHGVRLSLIRVSKKDPNTYLRIAIGENLWREDRKWAAGTKIEVEADPDGGLFRLQQGFDGFKLRIKSNNRGSADIRLNIKCFSEDTRKWLVSAIGEGIHDLKYTSKNGFILCNF